MAGRPVTSRLRVRGHLEVVTPMHVGGLGSDPDVDLPVAVDGMSRLYVPGTSLAGVFRAWMTGRGRVPGLETLWGYVEDVRGTASRVFVRDGLVLAADRRPLSAARLEARTSVGIDRFTGAAARGFLFSRAVVPVGCLVVVELDVESEADTAALDRARVGALLDALERGDVALGAASTRGLGRVRLASGVTVEEHDLGSPAGLIALLDGRMRRDYGLSTPGVSAGSAEPIREVRDADVPGSLAEMSATGRPAAPLTRVTRVTRADLAGDPELDPRDTLCVTITWAPRAPVMARADRDGVLLDTLPLTGADGTGNVRFVLPGASVKGALRAHAERILRTVAHAPAPVPSGEPGHQVSDGEVFRAQLAQLPLVSAMFGAAPEQAARRTVTRHTFVVPRDPNRPVEMTEEKVDAVPGTGTGTRSGTGGATPGRRSPGHRAEGGVGALAVADCRSSRPVDETTWRRLALSDELDAEHRDWLRTAGIAPADHVAIDRWTGGAADKLLFTVAEPWKVDWEPIELRVDLTRLGRADDPAGKPVDDSADSTGGEPADVGEDTGSSEGTEDGDPETAKTERAKRANCRDLALALLLLVLRDLRQGRLPLGGGTNRGFGDVTVTSLTIRHGDVTTDLDGYLASEAGERLVRVWRDTWTATKGAA